MTVELAGLGQCEDWVVELFDPIGDAGTELQVKLRAPGVTLRYVIEGPAAARAMVAGLEGAIGSEPFPTIKVGALLERPVELRANRDDAAGIEMAVVEAGADLVVLAVGGADLAKLIAAWRDAVDDLGA